jgi:hypothetical protein
MDKVERHPTEGRYTKYARENVDTKIVWAFM